MSVNLLIVYEKPFKAAANFLKIELEARYKIEAVIMPSQIYYDNKEYRYNNKKNNNIKEERKSLSEITPVILLSMNYKDINEKISDISKDKVYSDISGVYDEIIDHTYDDDGICIGNSGNRYLISIRDFPKQIKKFEEKVKRMKEIIETDKKLFAINNNILEIINNLIIGLGSIWVNEIITNAVKRNIFMELQSLLAVYDSIENDKCELESWLNEHYLKTDEAKSFKDYVYIIYEDIKWLHQSRQICFQLYKEKGINAVIMDYNYYDFNSYLISERIKIFTGDTRTKKFKNELSDRSRQETIYYNKTKKNLKIVADRISILIGENIEKIIRINKNYFVLGKISPKNEIYKTLAEDIYKSW